MNYFDLLKQQAERFPQKPLIIVDSRAYTYQGVLDNVNSIAASLPAKPHQPILIHSPDPYFQLTAFLAANAVSLVPLLSHFGQRQTEVNSIMELHRIPFLLTDQPGFFPTDPMYTQNHSLFLYQREGDFAKDNPTACMGVLSSGTTGVPKACYRTYESWADCYPIQNRIFGVSQSTVLFQQGTLSFTGNLNSLLSVMFAGGTAVVTTSLSAKHWIRLINEYAVNGLYLIPTKLRLFTRSLNVPNPDIKSIFAGSQLFTEILYRKTRQFFPNARITLYYGASELSYISYLQDDDLLEKPGCVGRPFPKVEINVVNNRIYVNTPYAVLGQNLPGTVDDNGHLDEQGWLYFDGRKDGTVSISGQRISTRKIEAAALLHPMVEEAAVIPFQDHLRGNQLALFAVCSTPIPEGDLRRHLSAVLNRQELPRRICILPEFPLAPSGKIDFSTLIKLIGHTKSI